MRLFLFLFFAFFTFFAPSEAQKNTTYQYGKSKSYNAKQVQQKKKPVAKKRKVQGIMATVRPDQFPEIGMDLTDANWEAYNQKNGVSNRIDAPRIKKYVGAKILPTPISYIPTTAGNSQYKNMLVKSNVDNSWYFIDVDGRASALGGAVDVASLISNNVDNRITQGTDSKLYVASNRVSLTQNNTPPSLPINGDIWIRELTTGKKFVSFYNGSSWITEDISNEVSGNNTLPPSANLGGYKWWFNSADNSVWAIINSNWIKIYPSSLNASQLGNTTTITLSLANGVLYGVVPANSITYNELADGVVNTDKLTDGGIYEIDLADNIISTAKIQNGAVTNDDLSNDCISTSKIIDNAITFDKLDVNCVKSANVLDGTIVNNDIADLAITGAKVANNSLPISKLDATGTNYADLPFSDGTNVTWGNAEAYIPLYGNNALAWQNTTLRSFPHWNNEDYFDFSSNSSTFNSYGTGVGITLSSTDAGANENSMWKRNSITNKFARFTFSTDADPCVWEAAATGPQGEKLNGSKISINAAPNDPGDNWVKIAANGDTAYQEGITIKEHNLYADCINLGTASQALYYDANTKEITYGSAPTGGVTYTQGNGISLASNVITNTATNGSNSVQGNGLSATPFKLVGDVPTPSTLQYYGTNVNGARGYYDLPSSASKVMVQVSKGVPQTIAIGQTVGIANWSNSLASNSNAAFNLVTGVFTAPRNGYYIFSYHVKFGGVSGIFNESISTTITTPQPNSYNFSTVKFFQGGETIPPTLENFCLLYLSIGQQVAVKVNNSTSNTLIIGQDLDANSLSIHEL
jgi:C1q domain